MLETPRLQLIPLTLTQLGAGLCDTCTWRKCR
jgi:hypothetical protein